jgi:hypothetical protein
VQAHRCTSSLESYHLSGLAAFGQEGDIREV